MSSRVEQVVLALCREIECDTQTVSPSGLCEEDFRRELVGCLLASQVRHAAAVAWTTAFEQAGLLDNRWWLPQESTEFRNMVRKLLAGRHRASRRLGRYRFFRVRAQQIATTRDSLAARPIQPLPDGTEDMRSIRRTLVHEVSGLGPKQASLFLRNLGIGRELAVLDRHVLRFMMLAGLLTQAQPIPGRMSQYEAVERVLLGYARRNGCAPGSLDWAIWATMKAAAELGL